MEKKLTPQQSLDVLSSMLLDGGHCVDTFLAQDIVAALEGYPDWKTMQAAPPPVAEFGPEEGPFKVVVGGETLKGDFVTFNSACRVARQSVGGFNGAQVANIINRNGDVRAAYADKGAVFAYEVDMRNAESDTESAGSIKQDSERVFALPQYVYTAYRR